MVYDPPFDLLLTENTLYSYHAIGSQSDLKAVNSILDILDSVPTIGRLYSPTYDAARPPFELYVVYAGNYGIYYRIFTEVQQVVVYFIEDQRRNPLNRFDMHKN